MAEQQQILAIQQAMELAVEHHKADRLSEAEAIYQQILRQDPNQAAATHMLGVLAHQAGKNELAVKLISKVIEIQPDLAEAYNNNGLALRELARLEDAETSFRKAIDLNHDYAEARYNLGMLQLLNGDYSAGWENYDWRWKMPQYFRSRSDSGQPSWDGDSLQGKTIFIYPEQGVGDTIQFVRYVPLITKLGAKVVLEAPEQLLRLFRHMKTSVDLVSPGEPTPPFDCHASLLDLPRLLRTSPDTIPNCPFYIEPDPNLVKYWENRLSFSREFRLGIVWAGNKAYQYDKKRSIDAHLFRPFVEIPGITVYSLQVGRDNESEKVFGDKVIDVGALLTDFSDTAAIINKMDLVVTTDTAVAHISGAVGCQTRILLPFIPDWRWFLGRDDTPWYSTMKLVRQPKLHDWETVISQIHTELIKLTN